MQFVKIQNTPTWKLVLKISAARTPVHLFLVKICSVIYRVILPHVIGTMEIACEVMSFRNPNPNKTQKNENGVWQRQVPYDSPLSALLYHVLLGVGSNSLVVWKC